MRNHSDSSRGEGSCRQQDNVMKFEKSLLLLLAVSCLGTTYVIKEGDVEVGRWEEADGKNETQIVGNDKPNSVKPMPAAEPIVGGEAPGYPSTKPEIDPNQKIAEWRVSGKVIDLLKLKAIQGCEVIFDDGTKQYPFKADTQGFFSGKIPKIEKGNYFIGLKGPVGYERFAHVLLNKSFSNMKYEDRLMMRGEVPNDTPIKGTTYDIEIGLYPNQMSEKELRDYQRLIIHHEEAGNVKAPPAKS